MPKIATQNALNPIKVAVRVGTLISCFSSSRNVTGSKIDVLASNLLLDKFEGPVKSKSSLPECEKRALTTKVGSL